MFIFQQLYGKSLSQTDLDKLQSRIIETLCHMEMLSPPTYNYGALNLSLSW